MSIKRTGVLIFLAAALLGRLASAGAQEGAPSLDAVVGQVEGRYSALVDLTAKVVQKNFLKSVGKTQTFEGTLSIKKPGKLRLDYTNGQLIVIDGADAWFYAKKSGQAIRRRFQDFEQANIPVAFLLGASTLRDSFDAAQPDPNTPLILDLLPKRPRPAMQKLTIETDGSGTIIRMTILDKSGNSSAISFAEIKENAGVEDSAFKFKAPKGTEIIEQ